MYMNIASCDARDKYFLMQNTSSPIVDESDTRYFRFSISIPSHTFSTITGYFERFIIYEDQKYNKSIDRFGANLVQRFQLKNRSFIDNKIVGEIKCKCSNNHDDYY